jgi:peptidoglycan/xylan/chitin deacetylase (PgdA/CDA1 family)
VTLKRTIRQALDHGARLSGLMAWMESRLGRGLTVLMYHRVLPAERCADYPFPSLVMPEAAFDEQMRWLAQRCEVLPVRDAIGARSSGSRPRVAVTFDDGYADNHELAAPILERHGLRGTFFVTTDFVASGTHLWFDRAALLLRSVPAGSSRACWSQAGLVPAAAQLADPRQDLSTWMQSLKEARPDRREAFLAALERAAGGPPPPSGFEPLTRAQVADLHRRGHEVGSHSLSHPLLPQLDERSLQNELTGSRVLLEEWIGAQVHGFCYPNGDHDERSVRAVRAAGYAYACTTAPGLNRDGADVLRLLRCDITPQRVSDTSGRFDRTAFRAELCSLHEVWR